MRKAAANEQTTAGNMRTTVEIKRDLHRRLKEIRPYESMSFHDLIEDMADQYDADMDA